MYEPYFDDDSQVVFRDVLLLLLAGFVVMLLVLLPFVNPEGKDAVADEDPPGNISVEASWDDEADVDVDLWVKAPGDVPVGYPKKGGAVFNLLRDDLGATADASGENYEVAYARGLVSGLYTVNVHLFRDKENSLPLDTTVVVSTRTNPHSGMKQILLSEVALERVGQEITVFNFRLDEDGSLVPGSVNGSPRNLRNWRAK